jgi:CRP-like cAMP-binding protein
VPGFDKAKVRNRLLLALSPKMFDAFCEVLEPVDLPLRFSLVEANEPTKQVCFVQSGLASMVAESPDEESIEIGHIGFEGMSAAHLVLATDQTPSKTFMQVAGSGLMMPADVFLRLLDSDVETQNLFLRYNHTCQIQLATSALANARYSIHERLARWLLMCHDRLVGDDMPLTHEFLALMPGVRRSGVTNELHILEGVHAIRATRGNVRILDREKLLDVAGGSYGQAEREYRVLIEGETAEPVAAQ